MNCEYIIDAELLKRALGTSMRNPELQRVFKEAPQAAKPVLKLKFAAMVYPDQISDDAFGANLQELSKSLDAEALQYLVACESDEGMRDYFRSLQANGKHQIARPAEGDSTREAGIKTVVSGSQAVSQGCANKRKVMVVIGVAFAFVAGIVTTLIVTSGESSQRHGADTRENQYTEIPKPEKCQSTSRKDTKADARENSLLKTICGDKRLTRKEWDKVRRRLEDRASDKLRASGYGASGITTERGEFYVMIFSPNKGEIHRGLSGGITYPAWLPEKEALAIWRELYWIESVSKDFFASQFYITPAEEEQEELRRTHDPEVQKQRRAFAKKTFGQLDFAVEKCVLFTKGDVKIKRRLVQDESWYELKNAVEKEDWQWMYKFLYCRDRASEYLPKEKDIEQWYRDLLKMKWTYLVVYELTGGSKWRSIEENAYLWLGYGEWRRGDEDCSFSSITDGEFGRVISGAEEVVAVKFTFERMPHLLVDIHCKKNEEYINYDNQFWQAANKQKKRVDLAHRSMKRNTPNVNKEINRLRRVATRQVLDWLEEISGEKVDWPADYSDR